MNHSVFPHLGYFLMVFVAVPGLVVSAEPRPTDTSALSSVELDLLSEFRENYYRLSEFYGNVKMECVHHFGLRSDEAVEPSARQSFPQRRRLVYRSRDNAWIRMDETELHGEERREGKTRFYIFRTEGALKAEKDADSSETQLVDLRPNCDLGKGGFAGYRFHRAPFSWIVPLEYVLLSTGGTGPVAVLDKIIEHELNGDRLVTIYVTFSSWVSHEPGPLQFTFLRDQCWALKELRFGDGVAWEGYEDKVVFAYSGLHEGIPLLRRAEYWKRWSARKERKDMPTPPWEHEVYEITDFVVGAVPAHEFTPEAIGLTIGRQTRRWGRRLVLAVGGGVLLAVYFIFRRRSAALVRQAS